MKAIIKAADFKRIFENTKKFVGDHYDNGLMSYIYLEVSKKDMEIKATALDGHKVSIEYAKLIYTNADFHFFIKPVIPKITKHDERVEMELIDEKAFVTVGDSIQGYFQPDGKYFDTSKILEEARNADIKAKVAVNPDYLMEAMKASNIPDMYSSQIAKIEIRDPNAPIIIRTGGVNGEKENIKIVLPMRVPNL